MLLMRVGAGALPSKSVTEILHAAERAANLVRQLLMFSRNQMMQFRNVDLSEIVRRLGELRPLGRPILVGLSRKSFIGKLLGRQDPAERLFGSLAATAVAVLNGAHLVRTHDVGATRDAIRMAEALRPAER
jgi:dihydropteroate synthase